MYKKIIIGELTNCINNCLELGTFPESLKIAKVTPIYKSGSKLDPGNYRPISVLPVLSKVFERVLYNRLETFLKSIKLLYDKQYGFRPKSNTLSATTDVITKIKWSIDKKEIILGIFIDLKKAFDSVSHEVLLQKLSDIGLTNVALDIFKSYLNNRQQILKLGKSQSAPATITFGVPQGSILGPLLFLIYINSIGKLGLNGDITLYADDTCLFYFGHSIDSIVLNAQKDLDLLNEWFQYNLLTINTTKTSYMIFAAKNKKIHDFSPLVINGKQIKKVEQEKYLGLILDNKLTWVPHIEKIKAKLRNLMGMIKGMARCLPRPVQYTIYNSLVKPHIDYLIEIWGTAAKTNLAKLQIVQNKLLKVLFHLDYLTPTNKLFKKIKVMNISETYTYQICILVRKILNKDIHTKITFSKKAQLHKMNLRSNNDNMIRLLKPRTNFGRKSIMYEGVRLYNRLPKNIKESKSMYTYKRLLKHHLMKNK
ncbi:hypothetical protein O3G_MSEX010807 [Manduca sexta]|uniref:Reverse transcriptase domain-containing protein n=1 Tax=Manduca sexta TaxID=7130 RepID=A0A921ZKD0_MANSE|nr:hypothetical protein O3G_MSEX010807 [Manduca sexta]